MKNVYKQKRQEGFTIIEVLIVLAIAALILLIVFLAVPSLQRNARNTQRKSDIANLASAMSNFEGNNSGALPTGLGYDASDPANQLVYCATATPATTGVFTVGNALGAGLYGCLATNKNFDSAKMGYYKPSDKLIVIENQVAGAPTPVAPGAGESASNVSTNSATVDLGYTCDSTGTTTGAKSSRSIAIFYLAEASTGNGNMVCVQS
jgi:prepilin-type N-terminal cleavage/methylation domain-containing protein